ncbi:hypothetical protein FRC0077_00043 [Corynebacterium diphtheriae]|nr:hypothetical protein FRC0077_00043 [Corynebacterium diphtheriae]
MTHVVHENHTHQHGPNCGHVAVPHGDHVDYVHDGHPTHSMTATGMTTKNN